ncbi:S41 family peptidase [Caldithrix abyssi]|uniref:C-terminal processing peptidase-3, Serine peptidase, MEROPS family S41A n=1 Tax=Caldithrix abyssi DSM 13497 TaxID=880073 RepID=H1XX63_CALAY|nr:S41 family peptidase [Caldithrix abyssi]APF20701.1 C-terminal processing peptidase-3, Serine peptidase, MEROPS family S41A [Caldithrix abyssi DSM 13497]EHO40800.1 carboxyl-terminal protease [Caldithrix abyssi DSM 13497]
MKKFRIHIWALFLLILSAPFIQAQSQAKSDDYYLELKKGWDHLQRVFELINRHYVDEIRPYPLLKSGIEGMLDKLDPYTVFIESNGEDRLRMITTGRYGGVGMEIGLRNKNVTVIAPIENSPAAKSGIQAGDIIEKIDGQDISGWPLDKVSSKLRGKVGTKVRLLIKRPCIGHRFEVELTRAEIVLEDVGYTGFVAPGVGYVSLKGFTEKAPHELQQAILSLKQSGQLNGLILDLRGNPGGLLESAVKVVNLFVPKNTLVVYTKGAREKEYRFYTQGDPILPETPLVVLVNGGSASASEIVAGALQDLDRAVIVGLPTFGKGLVQKVFNIDKSQDVKLKITTAKYYIPSGRCIQKKDYGKDGVIVLDSVSSDPNDHTFFTLNKRKVHDRGGIEPDVEVRNDSLATVAIDLIRKNMLFDFAVQFHQKHPQWADSSFTITPEIFNAFQNFLKEKDFHFTLEGEREIKKIKKLVEKRGYDSGIIDLIDQLQKKLQANKQIEFERHQDQIKELLRLELAEKYYGNKWRHKLALEKDKQVKKASEILIDQKNYRQILASQ